MCPVSYKKCDGEKYNCINKIDNWDQYKRHLSAAERILGELIAFPIYMIARLPPKSHYNKFRRYGYLHEYFKKEVTIFNLLILIKK